MPGTTPEPVSGPQPEQHPWDGERITNRLQIWEHESFTDMWIVCGKEGYLCGMASPQDLVKLAQIILQRFPHQAGHVAPIEATTTSMQDQANHNPRDHGGKP